MQEFEKQGLTKNKYAYIHTWLRRKYGPADKCENPTCIGKSKHFQWSLIKGFKYEKNRSNFKMLCISCHQKYDWIEEERQHLRNIPREAYIRAGLKKRGRKLSPEHVKKMSERVKGDKNPMFGVSMKGKDHPMYGKHLSDEAKQKVFNARANITKDQHEEIMKLDSQGIKQKDISIQFGISKTSVCRIVNKKRYKLWSDAGPADA